MKRLFLIILGLSICLFLASCSAGETNNKSEENLNADKTTDDISYDNNINSSSPPYVLSFKSFDQVAELKNVLNKDEEQVINFLERNNYHMNGLNSKRDISEMFDTIGNLNMLHIDQSSGYRLANISYYISYNYVLTTYKKENDIIRLVCYIDDSDKTVTSNKVTISDSEIVCSVNLGKEKIDLQSMGDEKSVYALKGNIYTPNSKVLILLSENDETEIKNVFEKNAISTTLNELIA